MAARPGLPVRVRMGEVVACLGNQAPGGLAIYGLGSCVAVFVYDKSSGRVGGMAHVLLPAPLAGSPLTSPGKFAPTAVAALVDEICQLGGSRQALRAKLVGGAQMFPFTGRQGPTLGERNVTAVQEALASEGIAIAGMDVGGSAGRSLVARIESGRVRVTSLRQDPREL